jgi:DNA-binding MarR family transcriptional regulator
MEESHGRVVHGWDGIFRNGGPGGNPSALGLTGKIRADPRLGQQFDNWQKVELCYISELMANSDRGRARMAAALGNHRRIEIIRLLRQKPDLPLEDIAHFCKVQTSTACEHVRRLHEAGMVKKKSKGRRVLHSATKRGSGLLRSMDLLWESPAN